MSEYSDSFNKRQFDRAQEAYDNALPPDDEEETRECDRCQQEYEVEHKRDGTIIHNVCESCRQLDEEGPQE